MSVASIQAAGRRFTESLMTDTCVGRRQTGETLDDSDSYLPVWETVYTGPCKVTFTFSRADTKELAGQLIAEQRPTLALPYDLSAGITAGDVFDITSQGVTVRVTGVFAQTIATARRFPGEILT